MPRLKWPYAAAIAVYCAGIFILSSQSEPPTPAAGWWDWPGADKVAHMALFGLLSGLVATGLWRSNHRLPGRLVFLIAVLFAVLYGFTDEIHQWFVPHRTFEWLDLLADAIGATIVTGGVNLYVAKFGGSSRPATPKGPE